MPTARGRPASTEPRAVHAVGFDELAWDLAGSLSSFLDLRHRIEEWELTHRLGLDAARRVGDRLGQAVVPCGLGDLHYRQDQYEPALAVLHLTSCPTSGF